MLDIFLLGVILLFGAIGLAMGFIHAFVSMLGLIVGVYLASRLYAPAADWLMQLIGHESNLIRVLMFAIAFILITTLVGIIFHLIEKAIGVIKWLPFVKTIDRLLGFLLGVAEGVIILGLIIFFIDKFPLTGGVMDQLANSVVAPYLEGAIVIFWPLLPKALKMIQSSVDYFVFS